MLSTMCNDLRLYVICLKDYDFALQASLDDWTSGCNYDVDVSLPGYAHAIKNPNIGDPGAKRMMRYAFNLSSAFYTVRRTRIVRD